MNYTIDLAKIYLLHGAGEICHLLVMGWGGECTATMELTQWLRREIHKSNKEIRALGIIQETCGETMSFAVKSLAVL